MIRGNTKFGRELNIVLLAEHNVKSIVAILKMHVSFNISNMVWHQIASKSNNGNDNETLMQSSH